MARRVKKDMMKKKLTEDDEKDRQAWKTVHQGNQPLKKENRQKEDEDIISVDVKDEKINYNDNSVKNRSALMHVNSDICHNVDHTGKNIQRPMMLHFILMMRVGELRDNLSKQLSYVFLFYTTFKTIGQM